LSGEHEIAIAEPIAMDMRTAPDDPTPRAVAAMVVAIVRMLMVDARAAVRRDDMGVSTKRRLRQTCDRAYALLVSGVGTFGARPSTMGATVARNRTCATTRVPYEARPIL
jgi:hypothetical protein